MGGTDSLCSVLGRNVLEEQEDVSEEQEAGAVVIKPSDHKLSHAGLTPRRNWQISAAPSSIIDPVPLTLYSLFFFYREMFLHQ